MQNFKNIDILFLDKKDIFRKHEQRPTKHNTVRIKFGRPLAIQMFGFQWYTPLVSLINWPFLEVILTVGSS